MRGAGLRACRVWEVWVRVGCGKPCLPTLVLVNHVIQSILPRGLPGDRVQGCGLPCGYGRGMVLPRVYGRTWFYHGHTVSNHGKKRSFTVTPGSGLGLGLGLGLGVGVGVGLELVRGG